MFLPEDELYLSPVNPEESGDEFVLQSDNEEEFHFQSVDEYLDKSNEELDGEFFNQSDKKLEEFYDQSDYKYDFEIEQIGTDTRDDKDDGELTNEPEERDIQGLWEKEYDSFGEGPGNRVEPPALAYTDNWSTWWDTAAAGEMAVTSIAY